MRLTVAEPDMRRHRSAHRRKIGDKFKNFSVEINRLVTPGSLPSGNRFNFSKVDAFAPGNGPGGYRTYHNGASDQGERGGGLADDKEYPERVEHGLQH